MWRDNPEKKYKSLIRTWKNKCLIVFKGIQIKTIRYNSSYEIDKKNLN